MNANIGHLIMAILILGILATSTILGKKEDKLKKSYKNDERYQQISSRANTVIMFYFFICLLIPTVTAAVMSYWTTTITLDLGTFVFIALTLFWGMRIISYLAIRHYDKKM